MSWKDILAVLDFGVLMWIAWMEKASLTIEKANHLLYSAFFQERTRWYAARNKKPPAVAEGGDNPVMVVATEDADSASE